MTYESFKGKPERPPVTHDELLRLRAEQDTPGLLPKERNRHQNRLIAKFRTAIKEARTSAELKALGTLTSRSLPAIPTCPHVVRSYLANRLKHYVAVEAKAAKKTPTPAAQLAEAH
jgi:hypothetical protein